MLHIELKIDSIFLFQYFKNTAPLFCWLHCFQECIFCYNFLCSFVTHFFSLPQPAFKTFVITGWLPCTLMYFSSCFLCSILRFLNLYIYGFHLIWKFFSHYFSLYFFYPLISLYFFKDSDYYTYFRLIEVVSQRAHWYFFH